jgi:hypothetical protein
MAQKTQGTVVYMQSGALAAATTITAITKANPAVVTTSAAHGYVAGDVVVINGVVGMQEVNARAFVVVAPSGSNFSLKGVDSTNYTTYTSGGTAQKATLTAIGEVKALPDLGGTEPNPIDVSHLQSLSTEEIAGLPKQSPITFECWFDLGTAGQSALIAANQDLNDRAFHILKPSRWNLTVLAQVSGFRVTGGDVNSAFSASVTLTPRAAGAWSVTA